MSGSIHLHPKYGVNPSIYQCFYCGEDVGLILPGSMTQQFKNAGVSVSDSGEMPMHLGVIDTVPCDKCKEYMKQGIIFISVRDGEDGSNPFRTGGFAVVKESAVDHIINDPALVADVKENRVCFIENTTWNTIGLPPLNT